MQKILISSLVILLSSAVIVPVARASGVAGSDAPDLNRDGDVSLTEVRINYLNTHDSSR
jgi:hypothetical protein